MKQTIVPVGILFCVVWSAIAGGYKMGQESKSMIPTIKPGDRVDVDKAAYRNAYPVRWDAVILRFPDEPQWEQASRIVGLPGETIGFTNGQMTVNGKPMSPPAHLSYLRYAFPIPGVPTDKHTRHPFPIPANSYYVLGDNPAGAKDSRLRGAIPRSGIVGKIVEQPGSNKGGAANGSQPIRSETNSASSAAGSRR